MRWESSADNDVKLEKKREISNTNGRPILKLTNNYQRKKKERKKEMEKENAGSHSQAANINNNNNINNNINNRRFWRPDEFYPFHSFHAISSIGFHLCFIQSHRL